MPLRIGTAQVDDWFAIGRADDGTPGVPLLDTQVATATSADPLTVIIGKDAITRNTQVAGTLADGTVVPPGTVTQASGKVSAAKPPAQVNVPINVTLHLANTDGTPVLDDTGAPIADVVDTVTVVPGLVKSEGMLFGAPAAAAAKTAAPAPAAKPFTQSAKS
jgi:hypothetical protein